MTSRRRPPATPSSIAAPDVAIPASPPSVVGRRVLGALVAGFAVGVGAVALVAWTEQRATAVVVEGLTLDSTAHGGAPR